MKPNVDRKSRIKALDLEREFVRITNNELTSVTV